MPIKLSDLPPAAKWRAMLVLRRFEPAALSVGYLLDKADADTGDVVEMAEQGWIQGVRDGGLVAVDVVAKWRDDVDIQARLTREARDWLFNSPSNLILFTIWAAAGDQRRGMFLYDCALRADAGFGWILPLAQARYVRLLNEDGETIDPADVRDTAVRKEPQWRIALTGVGVGIAKR